MEKWEQEKEICRQLSVADMVTSPTFTIVNEYLNSQSESIYHFDFYRIKSEMEAYDLGYENYIYSGSYCFIEWPEIALQILDIPYYAVNINVQSSGTRMVEINFIP